MLKIFDLIYECYISDMPRCGLYGTLSVCRKGVVREMKSRNSTMPCLDKRVNDASAAKLDAPIERYIGWKAKASRKKKWLESVLIFHYESIDYFLIRFRLQKHQKLRVKTGTVYQCSNVIKTYSGGVLDILMTGHQAMCN